MRPVRISGLGCTLLDFVYNGVDFSGKEFNKYRSRELGDGGLTPGHLVFLEDLEKFAGKDFEAINKDITGDRKPDTFNIGGPAVVSIIHAAQMLGKDAEIRFVASLGRDWIEKKILSILADTPVDAGEFLTRDLRTPFTNVFSDPSYNEGRGERTFINNIGAAACLQPEDLPEGFLKADILVLGGTALVPGIHDRLDDILNTAGPDTYKLINTVFDFRNERRSPGKPWPIGKNHGSFPLIDLMIMDREEALKISGQNDIDAAIRYFVESPLKSFIITNGTESVVIYSEPQGLVIPHSMPVSKAIFSKVVSGETDGDTTGAGDNFVGGVIYSIASQMADGKALPDLIEASKWGIVSGGYACFYMGGTFIEKYEGEKLEKIRYYYDLFTKQLENA